MSAGDELARDFGSTGVQDSLDRIVKQCVAAFDCPIAVVSLLEKTRQIFVSKVGIADEETPIEMSFCRHVVASGKDLLVEDAALDERFSSNPLVIGAPGIRSYAGSGIRNSSGQLIGALCVIDQQPEQFDHHDLKLLKWYADCVSDLIRLQESCLLTTALAREVSLHRDQLKSANHVFLQAERIAGMGSWQIELETGDLYWSEGVYRIHDIPPETRIGVDEAISYYVESDRGRVSAHVDAAITHGSSFEFEASLITPGGEIRRVRSTGEYIPGDGESSARVVGVIRDVTSECDSQAALEHAANYDSLTGLFNRHAFDRLVQARLNEHNETGQDVILLLLDLDGFKDVNDSFGHVAGDIILEEIAARIRGADLRGSLVARWGGDEFVVVLPSGTTIEQATEHAQSLIDRISRETLIGGRMIAMNATCGVARSERRIGARELIRRADTALYHGKKRNPGSISVYAKDMERENQHRLRAISDVQDALRTDRIYPGYQPIVDLGSRRCLGFEALLRLHSPQNRVMTATEVLPALIDPFIAKRIGERMIERITQELGDLFSAFPDTRFVSINASESDLLSPHFARDFIAAFSTRGLQPERITLEVTETMLLVNDTEAVRDVLTQLSAAGIRVALDDFGTGFSSLSHLRDFPIDKVKIDCSFVQGMPTKHDSRLIVQAIIGMARNLGIEVIAEGVETEDQRNLLMQMGCTMGQGFLFSPAMDIGQIKLQAARNVPHQSACRRVA